VKITIFHGSPRKGNTYRAAKIFMDGLSKCGDVHFSEFFLPEAIPVFCTGCSLCHSKTHEKCPYAQYTAPILEAIINADALIFTSPHYGACGMPGAMKNLLDHLDFLVFNVSPKEEMFQKKAFVITTGAGSAAAGKPIQTFLRHCGVNRVYSIGVRMFTDKWDKMPQKKQVKLENKLRRSASKFYITKKKHPYLSTVLYYHMTKFILKRYVGEDNYPYEYWREKGYFKKRPF
jgi:multimeric flavodoxin WrbA